MTLPILVIIGLLLLVVLMATGVVTVGNQETVSNNNLKYANQTTASVEVDNLEKGNGKIINIKIDNGNIVFTSDNNKLTLSGINAKYMFLQQYMESCSTKLYYINKNNELYITSLHSLVCQYDFDKDKLNIKKVTDSKVTDFLGLGQSYSRNDNMMVTVDYKNLYYLLEDGSIESLVVDAFKHNN